MRKSMTMIFVAVFFSFIAATAYGGDREILGVKFADEKVVAGKTLQLNGVSYLKKLWVKVYAGGLYLENPTKDPKEVIESEQVKQFYLHYLTDKATAEKLREGFIEMITENNPPDLVEKNRANIEKYVSWFDKGMAPGKTSITTYVPGRGLTLEWQGEEKGTIPGSEFAQMYFRYTFGEKADGKLRNGYLGIAEQ